MRILVTAGPTREWLDPVRFLSNPSTGTMGYLVAGECLARGDEVFLVSGPTALAPPEGAVFRPVETAREMAAEVAALFPRVDCLFMTAAVSDWRPRFSRCKIKKRGAGRRALALYPNPDILAACGRRKKKGQVLFGFALETTGLVESALAKIRAKNLDWILVNDPGFFGTENRPHSSLLVSRSGAVTDLSDRPKEEIARLLRDRVEED